nr:MAG TPA: hypothetical protein [Caudoviricetes sp.]
MKKVEEVTDVSGKAEKIESPVQTNEKAAITASVPVRIYIGPSIKGVSAGTVYKGELPPMLNDAIAELPAIRELVIPVNEVVTANKLLADSNTALSRFYEMAKNYKKGE